MAQDALEHAVTATSRTTLRVAEQMLETRRIRDPDGVPLNRDLSLLRSHLAAA